MSYPHMDNTVPIGGNCALCCGHTDSPDTVLTHVWDRVLAMLCRKPYHLLPPCMQGQAVAHVGSRLLQLLDIASICAAQSRA